MGSKNDKGYVLNLEIDTGSNVFVPNLWDFAMNSAIWTVDEFLGRAHMQLDALLKSLELTP